MNIFLRFVKNISTKKKRRCKACQVKRKNQKIIITTIITIIMKERKITQKIVNNEWINKKYEKRLIFAFYSNH